MKKRVTAMFMALLMVLSLAACGGSSVRADDALTGSYVAVAGSALGVMVLLDEADSFSVELNSGGKGSMTVTGKTKNIKWENDDETITLKVEGEEIVGKLQKDSFLVENMLNQGMDFIVAKKGTDAMDPANYLPESEKFMLGDWQSDGVTDILGDPVEDMAGDALQLSFSSDHKVKVKLAGEDLGTFTWSNLGDSWGGVDDESISLNWDIESDGLKVNYNAEEYYVFHCPKGGAGAAAASAKEEKKTGALETEAAKTEAETSAAETEAETTAEETEAETTAEETTAEETTAAETAAEIKNAKEEDQAAGGGVMMPYAELSPVKKSGKAGSGEEFEYWNGPWYGWYKVEGCDGVYEDAEDMSWDCCADISFFDDNTGTISIWDMDGSRTSPFSTAEVSFGAGTTSAGAMMSEKGNFMSPEENLEHADWIVDPGASEVSGFEHMICIDGKFENERGSFMYYVFLRPWGTDWSDVEAGDDYYMPNDYDWYTSVMNGEMPDSMS